VPALPPPTDDKAKPRQNERRPKKQKKNRPAPPPCLARGDAWKWPHLGCPPGKQRVKKILGNSPRHSPKNRRPPGAVRRFATGFWGEALGQRPMGPPPDVLFARPPPTTARRRSGVDCFWVFWPHGGDSLGLVPRKHQTLIPTYIRKLPKLPPSPPPNWSCIRRANSPEKGPKGPFLFRGPFLKFRANERQTFCGKKSKSVPPSRLRTLT